MAHAACDIDSKKTLVTHVGVTLQVLLEPLSAKSEIFAQSSLMKLMKCEVHESRSKCTD